MALDEFIDEFYLDHPDKRVQQGRIDAVPDIVGDPFVDAWIGAAGEHLAQRWGLQVPTWTLRAEHSALQEPRFVPDSRALKGVFLVESPPAFRSRLLFTGLEPFERARFPLDMPRARTLWNGPSASRKRSLPARCNRSRSDRGTPRPASSFVQQVFAGSCGSRRA